MNIAVCDDNSNDLKQILFLLKGRYQYSAYSCAENLLFDIEEGINFDLYILDILMDNMSGIELAEKIKQHNSNALICFISSSNSFYREAYNLYVFQYLIKPIKPDEFESMLRHAEKYLLVYKKQYILITKKGKLVRLPYDSITFIESQNHTLFFYCKDGIIEKTTGQLDEIEKTLNGNIFVRCHQSYIVNIYNVESLEKNFFVCGNSYVPISRKYKNVKERFREMLFEEME